MWQFLKLYVLLSLARQGNTSRLQQCRLLPSEEEATTTALLFSYLLQTKANRKVPFKERTSKLQAGIKASADLAFIQIHVCSFPLRTCQWGLSEKPHKVSLISHTFLKYWLKPPWKSEGLETLGLSPNPEMWYQGRQLGWEATSLTFPDKWGICLVT